MNKEPLLSVLLPTRNAQDTIEKALESISQQSYSSIEIIAIDDFSKDATYSLLSKYKRKEKRLKIAKNVKRYGMAATLNRLIRKAKGSYIVFASPHDINTIHRFKKQITYLSQHPKTVAVGTQCFFSNNEKRTGKSNFPLTHDQIYEKFLQDNTLHYESVVINKLLLPKDLLYFKSAPYPFLFKSVFAKFFQYGTVANLTEYLITHKNAHATPLSSLPKFKQFSSHISLLLQSITQYDYRPSLRSFFQPLITR